jgi:hypothetical protein
MPIERLLRRDVASIRRRKKIVRSKMSNKQDSKQDSKQGSKRDRKLSNKQGEQRAKWLGQVSVKRLIGQQRPSLFGKNPKGASELYQKSSSVRHLGFFCAYWRYFVSKLGHKIRT